MIKVFCVKDSTKAQKVAASALNKLLEKYFGKQILLLLSGGSSFKILTSASSKYLREHITLGMLDERYSRNPKVNNFAQLAATKFFKSARTWGVKMIETRIKAKETLQDLTVRFERALQEWIIKYPAGKIIILQGIGSDGHTAGIMPYPEDPDFFQKTFDVPEHWVVGYDAKEKNEYPLRVTVTLPFLRQVHHSVAYILGEQKRQALARLLAADGTLWETPARVMREMREVKLFTDIVY